VWAYAFTPERAAREIDSTAIASWLTEEQHTPDDSFLWLHWSLGNIGAERWLRGHIELPEAFYESLRDAQVSTRLEQEGNVLVAVVHDVLFGSSFEASDISTVTLCIQPRLLVTVRLRPLRSVDRLREAVRSGKVFRSSGELLTHLLRDQADVLVDILRESTTRVDAIEDQLLSGRVTLSRRELGTLDVHWSDCNVCWRRNPLHFFGCSMDRRLGSAVRIYKSCVKRPKNSRRQWSIRLHWWNA